MMGNSLQWMVRLEAVLDDARAARPERVEATDATGTIRVTLGPDALPVSMSVGADWRRAVGSERFAAAVVEACQAAAGARMAAWTAALGERGTPAAVARLREEIDRDEPAPEPELVLDSLVQAHLSTRPRPVDEVVRDISRLTRDMPDAAGEARPASGSGAFGNVVVTLSPAGEVSCAADPGWVSRQEADDLGEALNAALASARAALGRRPPAAPTAAVNGLLVELLASVRSA